MMPRQNMIYGHGKMTIHELAEVSHFEGRNGRPLQIQLNIYKLQKRKRIKILWIQQLKVFKLFKQSLVLGLCMGSYRSY